MDYLHHSALNAEALSNPRLISTTKVIQNFQNPKIEAKYALSTTPTFYSNAEFAVRGIKQEKATPEQWLKMIEKNGGLNAGEVEARNVSARINMTPEERRATLLSETEDVAREDQIFLREGAEMAMSQPKYSLSEETTKIFDAAKAKFGTTLDMREAGYILPDGSMLDFSGRHQVEGDASFLNGDRTVDHREISDIAYDAEDNETGVNTDLGDFLDRGAIRIDSNAGAINLNVAPTKAQKDRLKRLIERNDGYVYIDFGKGWDTEHYAEYEGARASRVLGDIDRYFDEGIKPTGNVRFSLQEVNTRFNEELEAFKAGQNVSELHLGIPSPLLRACGVSASEIFITAKTLRDHLKKHNLTEDEIKNLPIAINDPIMVYEWGEKAKSKIIITQIPRGEQRITVAIKMERGGKRLSVNELASVHGKDVERLINEMLTTKSDFGKDNLKYVNKEIAMQWLGIAPPEGAASLTDAQQSIAKIIKDFPNPKIEARNSLITPEMDASYLDAVERGDMATAQRMVMEAAKLAMPNTKVVDEDGNPKVVWHGTGSEFYTFRKTNDINELGAGYYFTDSYEMAERYATDETLADNRFRAEALAFDIFTDEMGHSEEDYEDIEFEDDYNKAYDLAVGRLFGNGHVKSVFLNIEKPRILSRESSDFDPVYQYGFNLHKEGTMAQRYNDGIIDELFSERHEGLTGNQYVTFAPNQIKSADPVTYDDAGNVIPLSERFNPEKEDIRYSLRSMDEGMAILRNKATEYNIDIPFILVENASEYVAMMQEMGMKNAEKKARAFATYIAKERLICFNGSHFLDADADFIENAILHEYTHHATAQSWDEVIALVATMNRDDILWVRDNMLTEHYNDIPAATTINEIISTFVEEMDAKMRTAAFKGEIEISKIVESVREEIANDTEIDDKGKGVLIATLPLVAKALEFIKEKYNGERETAFVLRRDTKYRANGNRMGKESEAKSQEPTKAMRDGDGRDREYSQPDRNARRTRTVDTRYSLPDIPFFEDEGEVVIFNEGDAPLSENVVYVAPKRTEERMMELLESQHDDEIGAFLSTRITSKNTVRPNITGIFLSTRNISKSTIRPNILGAFLSTRVICCLLTMREDMGIFLSTRIISKSTIRPNILGIFLSTHVASKIHNNPPHLGYLFEYLHHIAFTD